MSRLEVLRKLASMGPRELAGRTRDEVYQHFERIGFGFKHPHPPHGFLHYLRGEAAKRFYRGTQECPREFAQQYFPEWIDKAVEDANRLCRGQLKLLGHEPVQLKGTIDWHRDPITGVVWERRFWADYRPEHDPHGRDSKIIHELNRHQHLPRLAKAFRFTGDESYAAEAVAQLESWICQNPPEVGINWQSSLEIAIRSISWLWTVFLLLPSRSLDEASAQRIGESLFAQLAHVSRHTSLYSSPNTHLIGEAAALFLCGLVFCDLTCGKAWLKQGTSILVQEIDKQVLVDGVYGELSSYYHCYALDFYLQCLVLGKLNGFPLPSIRNKVESMLHFLMHLTRPDGTIPLLGDDDGGRALALTTRNYRSFADALSLGSVMFGREDFKDQSREFHEESFWLAGRDAWQAYQCIEGKAPSQSCVYFPAAGCAIQRSGWSSTDSHLVFDCGGLGMLTGGHSHADALSITLFDRGRELLVDPGTFVYNGAPEWRSYFRSTRGHNTVTIDGRDQAEMNGTFRWRSRMAASALREPTWPEEYLEAEHDGYTDIGVTHRRRLLRIPSEYWVVVDDFAGSGEHTFDFHFHFAPDADVSLIDAEAAGAATWAQDAGLFLGVYASDRLNTVLLHGENSPVGGWTSTGYGEKQPSSTQRSTLTGVAPAAVITLIVPGTDRPQVEQLDVGGGGIACSVKRGRLRDIIIFCADATEIRLAGFRVRGEFFWLRLDNGVLKKSVAIRASELTRDAKRPEEDTICAQSAAF